MAAWKPVPSAASCQTKDVPAIRAELQFADGPPGREGVRHHQWCWCEVQIVLAEFSVFMTAGQNIAVAVEG